MSPFPGNKALLEIVADSIRISHTGAHWLVFTTDERSFLKKHAAQYLPESPRMEEQFLSLVICGFLAGRTTAPPVITYVSRDSEATTENMKPEDVRLAIKFNLQS